MNKIQSILESIPSNIWDEVKYESFKNNILNKLGWWHHKYYFESKNNDGHQLQKFKSNLGIREEVPYERELFYNSNGRFSLINQPISYFSNDFSTSCCETIEEFRVNNNLSYEKDLKPYFQGSKNPTPGFICYPINIKINSDALIFDISKSSNEIIKIIKDGIDNLENKVLLSRTDSAYESTITISEMVFAKGFDGIVFKSVRIENDWNHPDKNLVLFNKSKMLRC